MIVGRSGSGKSTFALKLRAVLGLPLYHLDRYFFTANWVERETSEFLRIQQKLVDQDKWIIDGNCLGSIAMRYGRADTCIYFDYPRWLCYWRAFKRRFYKDTNIKDRPEECPERISLHFLRYIWNFNKRIAGPLKVLQQQYPYVQFIVIKRDRDLQKLIQQIVQKA